MDKQVKSLTMRIETIERGHPQLKANKAKVNELSIAVSNAKHSEIPLAQARLDAACTELNNIVKCIVNTPSL